MKLTKSSWLVVRPEFQRLDNLSSNGSMEKNLTLVSILIRLFVMVPLFKEVLSVVRKVEEILLSLMPRHCHWVLRLLEVL